jgi:ABC-2 type transport system permease protein
VSAGPEVRGPGRMSPSSRRSDGLGLRRTAVAFARLKWHLLLGGLRGSTQQRVQTLLSAAMAVIFGLLGAAVLTSIGRAAPSANEILVVLLPVSVLGLGVLAAATGVEASLDPRHLAGEPLTPWERGVGLLAAAVVGPGALLAVLAGFGLAAGWGTGGPTGWAVTTAAILAWWVTLLLFSRMTANLLGAVASGRLRVVAQMLASSSAVLVWFGAQFVARRTRGWDAERWRTVADVAQWTPPGQLGRAVAAIDRPGAALAHLILGVLWLPLLGWVSVRSTLRLTYASPRPGGGGRRSLGGGAGLRSGLRRFVPRGPTGSLAARTLATKVRTPRQAVNTITALLVGAGVVLVGPVFDGMSIAPRMVMVGGLLHFAVIFDGNNAYGMDGPAMWVEVASGADAGLLTRAKVLTSVLVMAVPTALLPVVLAVMSGGWQWLPAAWLIGAGSLTGAAGVSIVGASFAPVALPDSPNPLAAGDTGQGCVAGLVLGASMLVLGVVSLPVAAVVVVASGRSVAAGTAAALLAPVIGSLLLAGCMALARGKLRGREAELVQAVTPGR